MAAAMNGMAQHRGVLPLGGTFFCFSDYMRPSVRLASLTGTHVIYSWTHDSIGLGEDGPTHQPIEHLASLRAMPGLSLVRPADANETAQAWRLAVEADGPVGLVLTRQNVPVLDATAERAPAGVAKGAYVLVDSDGPPRIVLVGTGSEVQLCVAAAATLAESGVPAQVVSFPSWDHFERQPEDYRATVFPPGVPVLSIEAGATFGWERYADDSIGIDHFGASAPGDGRHGEVRLHRRARGRAGPGPPGQALTRPVADATRRHDEGSCSDDPTAGALRDRRPEPLARQPAPGLARRTASWPTCSQLGVRGITSNPTIFANAISGQDTYDDQFRALMKDHTVDSAYWEMAITDIDNALAMLRPLYDESDREDGFVSLEVSPALAHDTDKTLKAARDLHARIAQPNLLVKVPATKEGVPAIETLIGEGHSINVTLIFGLDRYDEVMEAYLQGPRGPGGRGPRGRAVQGGQRGLLLRQPGRHRGRPPPGDPGRRRARVTPPSSACAAPPRWPRPRAPTNTSTAPSPASAGRRCGTRAPACSGRCGRRPRPRTRPTPTCSTSTA